MVLAVQVARSLVSERRSTENAMDYGGHNDYSVYIGDLAPEVDETYLASFFRAYYPSCRTAKVMTDPSTGASKGYGFVRFADMGERDRAVREMNGVMIGSSAIRTDSAGAGGGGRGQAFGAAAVPAFGSVAAAPAYGSPQPLPGPPIVSPDDPRNTTLFVGGVSGMLSEDDMKAAFGQCGQVVYARIPPGKGCGFVQMADRASAERAMSQMAGFFIGGSSLRVEWGRSVRGGGGAGGGGGGYPAAPPAAAYGASSYPAAPPTAAYSAAAYGSHPAGAYHGSYGSQAAGGGYAAAGAYAGGGYAAAGAYGGYAPAAAGYDAYGQGGYSAGASHHQYGGAAAGHHAHAHTQHANGGHHPHAQAASAAAAHHAPAAAAAAPADYAAVYDPLVAADVGKLNAEYMARQLPLLAGAAFQIPSN
ncbi:hypothetical protein FOA52_011819 [Chlamydomonas sp. UWO 241]|nr:hypothetical protein FOA52_011819 [Chlamydomonas sp. UWO 241]